jgi:7-keto-8-aminopelargonate synthetase-like enzyme
MDQNKKTNESKTNNSAKPKDTYIDNSLKAFAIVNVVLLPISAYFSTTITIGLLVLLITAYLFISSEYGKKQMDKLKIYMEIRPYLKASKSLNHSTTLIGKYITGLPVKLDETEVETFNEIKDHFGEKWPFMKKVENTRATKIRVEGKDCVCISSYNYLDLGRDERCQIAAVEAANAYSSGNHGPRMLCGNLQILEDLEVKIAKFFKKDHALVFSSGFLACMSTIAGIARKGDLLLMDKLSHASLRTGAKICSAKTVFFKHNDFKDAEKIIKKNKFNRLIMVIEGIYSMDGDIGDLPTARKLCDKYNGILVMDEAHSLGTLGKTGHGTEEHFNYTVSADIICGTFTKSISSVGGFLTCKSNLREYYTFYAPGLVFSAPLSAYHCGAAYKAFEIIENEPQRAQKAQANGEYLRNKLIANGFNIGETVTNVIPVMFRDIIQVVEMHHYMLKKGCFAAAVMAPACPLDAPRYRICATSADTKESLDFIVNLLIEARKAHPESEKIKKLVSVLK